MFRFGSPEYLYLLLLLPVLAAAYVWYVYNRRKRLEKFGKEFTVRQLMPLYSPRKDLWKFIFFLTGIALIIFGLARPQFGSRLKEINRKGLEIMLAVDVSNSMLAQDFEPNRLERTKFAIDRLLEQLAEDRLGVVVFAGDAYVQLPITSDYLTARAFVRQLSTNMVSRQGTAMGAAIDLAANSFSTGSEGSRVIIIISDGENHEDDPVRSARNAAEKGITIYTIGVGTPEGAPIFMNGDFIRDENGNMVVTKLDESTLEQVAFATGGSYVRATNRSVGLSEIIDHVNELEKQELRTMVFEDYDERFQYLIGAALILLLIEFLIINRRNRIFSGMNIFRNTDRS
ncbi:MAG: VWA domain-containing protein [Rikenellaceae bacterium]|nr:VWA domain-containing protein [Rikenellaceae bacterium]